MNCIIRTSPLLLWVKLDNRACFNIRGKVKAKGREILSDRIK